MNALPQNISLRAGSPDFLDLPWDLPLLAWPGCCDRLEDAPRGVSRHPVVFVNYAGVLYALKELPLGVAENEYDLLREINELKLPAVAPVGHAQTENTNGQVSVLITRYLENSLPYRMLFMSQGLERYRSHLLDAIAGLLVQIHLAGVYWGDCSLSNTLFRRDAGVLRAYLVDAETAEIYPDYFPPTMRLHDLQIMEENLDGDLRDLHAAGLILGIDPTVPVADTGAYIRLRYQRLWDEITHEDIVNPDEHYRIQERIRALNELGFSVGDVELAAAQGGNQLRLRVAVTDRNFHRDQLYSLTGLDAEEMQARKMMNEIQELRATLSRQHNRSTPLGAAAFHWLEQVFAPTAARLADLTDEYTTLAELYCQILEHKWYLSEQAHRDVGHQAAIEDYLHRFGTQTAA
ncbi:MAG: DUF4032 domain-containing protein [Anaerolineales bacterium]|nr:DUF4032 domain-containing protein [Anaerolineales bacterium]